MAAEVLLQVADLEVEYEGGALAVHGATFDVRPGEKVALLGPNGAGKTTILRAITGFLASDRARVRRGRIMFDGTLIAGSAPGAVAALGICLVAERMNVFTSLTVEENLRAVPVIRSRAERAGVERLVQELFPALVDRRRSLAGSLSGGERQMLGLARALLLRPRVLLTDEITLGLAPVMADRLLEALDVINREEGMTLLMAEQGLYGGCRIADRVSQVETGRVVRTGPASEIAGPEFLGAGYLGAAPPGRS